jgi:drug/metabolite transporter (DMT)-like permease
MFERLSRPTSANAIGFLILTMIFWSGNNVLGKWAVGSIPPMTFAFLRWSVAGLILLPFAMSSIRRDWPIIRANLPILTVLGLLGSGYYNTLQYVALTETSVANAAILNSWAPVLIAAAGALLFKDRLRPVQIGGLALSLLGVTIIILRGDPALLTTLSFNRGDLVMVFATAVWAAYTTLLRKRPAISTLSYAGITYLFAGFANAPLAAYEFASGQHVVWSWTAVAAIAYAAVLASVIGYALYARSVEIIGATRAGAFIHLIPLFATTLAIVALGERPQPYHAAGFVMILAGVALASRQAADSPPAQRASGP